MKKQILPFAFCLLPFAAQAAMLDANAPKTISAPKIEYNVKDASIKTTGRTEITNASGQRMTLKDSYLGSKGDNAEGSDIELVLGSHTFVKADSVVRKDQDTIAQRATYTACYGCDEFENAWEISTSKLTHSNENHMIGFYNPIFWLYGAPVLWFPYLEYPDPTIKHKSGILTPDFNSTNNMGTQFNLPVYLALSDTHDATITLSYLTQENPLVGLEHRLNAQHSEFRTKGSFTRNKEGDNRWHLFNDDLIEMGENLRGKIYLERSSDQTYLQKYGLYDDQPYLDSGAKLELFGESGYAIADAHLFQELRASAGNQLSASGDILPNIRGVYQTAPLFDETYASVGGDIMAINGSGTASQRMIGEAKLISPWTVLNGQRITAATSMRYDVYNFDNTLMIGGNDFTGVKNRFLPSGYLEWGMPLMRPGENWTHIIEPRARLTAMRRISEAVFAANNDSAGALLSDATLFSDNRFAGQDLWENGTYADYGARFAAFSNGGDNIELFLGQTYDFTRQEDLDPNSGFHNGASDFVGRAAYSNSKWLELSSRFRMAEDTAALRHIENAARFGTARNNINFGHIWAAQFIDAETLDKNINELTGGFAMHLTGRLGIRWNGIYNITDSFFQRHSGGVFYVHPCYELSLEYRRDNAVKEDYVGNTTFRFGFNIKMNGEK
ncbi:MAG: LPS assembly protein LptD [Rickettsiales bacterium]|nr:LPS assembly protein LptD [Rickettsiales bacterium]